MDGNDPQTMRVHRKPSLTRFCQLVREYLAALVAEPGRRRLARARLRKAFETGLVGVGKRKWSRDDLYDR